jgi:hypothetical protein
MGARTTRNAATVELDADPAPIIIGTCCFAGSQNLPRKCACKCEQRARMRVCVCARACCVRVLCVREF